MVLHPLAGHDPVRIVDPEGETIPSGTFTARGGYLVRDLGEESGHGCCLLRSRSG